MLTHVDAAFVQQCLSKQIAVTRPLHGHGYLLNPGQFVGVVRLPSGQRLECRPKVPVRNFFLMLARAFDLEPAFLEGMATFQRIDDVFEFVIAYFAELVDRRITHGLYRTYIEREDNLPTVRGRIVTMEDIRQNHILRHRTYCRFTELTWDIPENQIIRQVAHMTAGWVRNPALRQDLRQIDQLMGEITPVSLAASVIDRFTYHRLNEDYKPIHQLCRLLLEGSTLSENEGLIDFRTFLFDMNALFETFVTRLLQERLKGEFDVLAQYSLTLGTGKQVAMKPDIVIQRDRVPMLAIDCKYKRIVGEEYKHHDQYQILAYCTALNAQRGLLIYPKHEVTVDDRLHVRNSDIQVRRLSLDLGLDRAAFDAECQTFTVKVANWADPGVKPEPNVRRFA